MKSILIATILMLSGTVYANSEIETVETLEAADAELATSYVYQAIGRRLHSRGGSVTTWKRGYGETLEAAHAAALKNYRRGLTSGCRVHKYGLLKSNFIIV